MAPKKKTRAKSPSKQSKRKGKKELTEEEQELAEQEEAKADAERVRESIIREEKAVAKAKRIALAAEEESSKRFTGFKGLYGIGTHDIFFYRFVHISGFCVTQHSCNCPYCIRGYRPDGFWTAAKGCLMNEPQCYIICERTDAKWKEDKKRRLNDLSIHVRSQGFVEDDVVAIHNKTRDVNDYVGESYDPKFPKSIFGGFTLVHVAEYDNDSISGNTFSHRNNSRSYDLDETIGFVTIAFTAVEGVFLHKFTSGEVVMTTAILPHSGSKEDMEVEEGEGEKKVEIEEETSHDISAVTLTISQVEMLAKLRFNGMVTAHEAAIIEDAEEEEADLPSTGDSDDDREDDAALMDYEEAQEGDEGGGEDDADQMDEEEA